VEGQHVTLEALLGRVVLLGGEGMLGRAFIREFENRSMTFLAPTLTELDITDVNALSARVPEFGLVINCAAWTDVDLAETQEALAHQVNGEAVGKLATVAAERRTKVVHFSTDYVFDGTSRSPYAADAVANPINAYGRSKLLGETLLQAQAGEYLLLRTSWLYAPWGKNFVRTIAEKAANLPELRVVTDQIGRPTSAQHQARITLQLLAENAQGLFHVTDGGEPCSWFRLAQEIVRSTGAACVIQPCTTDAFPRPARRPRWSVLDTRPTEDLVGPFGDWTVHVAQACKHLRAQ
jgi:dTDP-4-dehydrorhamnose reductase